MPFFFALQLPIIFACAPHHFLHPSSHALFSTSIQLNLSVWSGSRFSIAVCVHWSLTTHSILISWAAVSCSFPFTTYRPSDGAKSIDQYRSAMIWSSRFMIWFIYLSNLMLFSFVSFLKWDLGCVLRVCWCNYSITRTPGHLSFANLRIDCLIIDGLHLPFSLLMICHGHRIVLI